LTPIFEWHEDKKYQSWDAFKIYSLEGLPHNSKLTCRKGKSKIFIIPAGDKPKKWFGLKSLDPSGHL